MKVERRDGSRERTILTAMLVDTQVLSRLAPKWDKEEGLFKSTWANIVAKWAVRYFEKYGKAPKKAVEGLFEAWADNNEDKKDVIQLVEKFLAELSGQYASLKKKVNPDFVVDQAGEHFNRVKLDRHILKLQGHRDNGDLDEALVEVNKFGRIEIGESSLIDLFNDESVIHSTFEQKRESLVKYPGDLGKKFYKDALEREGFIAYMAPDKRGKSFQIQDLAFRAMCQRRRTLYFEAGDLSQRQIINRFMVRAAGRPYKPHGKDNPVMYPASLVLEDGKPVVTPVPRIYEGWLDSQEAWKACRRIAENKVKSKDSYFKLGVNSNSSLTVASMSNQIDALANRGWVPDVVIVDYADILAPPRGFNGESRDAINENWKSMRRISQDYKCLMSTVTQVKATAYTSELLNMEHFSEDKRKFAHVTGMIGINQSSEMKKLGLFGLNWLVLREDEFYVDRQCYCAGSLALGNPAIRSVMA